MSSRFNFHKVELLEHFNDCSKCVEFDTCFFAKKGYVCNDFIAIRKTLKIKTKNASLVSDVNKKTWAG